MFACALFLQLPVEQLAWLLRDQDCRVIICGHGIAGAVAQHAAMCVQQKLKSFDPEPDQPPPDAEVGAYTRVFLIS